MRLAGAGGLRHRVWLESLNRIDDQGGGSTIEWQQLEQLWAAIRPLSGGEEATGGKRAQKLTYEILLRYRDGVLPEMRFRLGERLFYIDAVYDLNGRRRWLQAVCEERE